MKLWFKKNRYVFILMILGVACFFMYSFLAFSAPKEIFNSPDETANYVFSCNFAKAGTMKLPEDDNLKVQGMIHPRSAIANYNGDIVPGYFLGAPMIFGYLGKILGCSAIPFVLPVISAITPIFFYLGLKKIFEKDVALISAVLLYCHPIFLYYTAKSLMPNVLFIDFLIISIALVLIAPIKKGFKGYFHARPLIAYFFSGIFLALGLTIRPAEIFWVFFLYVVLFAFRIRYVNWPGLFLGLCGFGIMIVPNLLLNYELYGGYFQLGYNTRLMGIDLDNAGSAPFWRSFFSRSMIFPFGVKLAASGAMFINYFWRFLGWYNLLLLPGLVAFFVYLWNDKKLFARKIVYLIAVFDVSVYLILYYGSYLFSDHIDSSKISIGSSYLRYWLPIFILLLPLMSSAIYAVWRFASKQKINIKCLFLAVTIMILSLNTFGVVFSWTDESLVAVKHNLEIYQKIRNDVVSSTEENAIIITDRADKIFFPPRKVVVFLDNFAIWPLVEIICEQRPVYYYTMMPPADMKYFLSTKVTNARLTFDFSNKINNFYLYKIKPDKF
ncbi:MAG: hypothetical protein ACOZBH_05100 [Patescibacteria group bacterium]